jgi:hypothetical protein
MRAFKIRDGCATKVAWGRRPLWRNYVRLFLEYKSITLATADN